MKIIGITTTYNGKDWRWMRGLTVRIIAVCKRLDPADEEYELCTDDRMIQRLGRDQEQDGLHPRGDEPLSGVDGGGRCGAASDAAMSPEEMRRARLSQQIISQLAESTGRWYAIELMRLDERSLMALHQALRELQDAHQSALRRARTRP